jgi:hypothetical protein
LNLNDTIEQMYSGGPGSGRYPKGSGLKGETRDKYMKNGEYVGRRIKLHDKLIEKFEHKPSQVEPKMHVTAGGAASGKTGIAAEGEKILRAPAHVNVDDVKASMPEFKQVVGTDKGGLLQEEASDVRDKILLAALGHNNDIGLDAVGSKNLAVKLNALAEAGYKINVSYVHRPTDESYTLAQKRAATSDNPASRRVMSRELVAGSHAKARDSLGAMMGNSSNRGNVKIYDATNHMDKNSLPPVIYERENGKTLINNKAAVERMCNSEEPRIPTSLFQ